MFRNSSALRIAGVGVGALLLAGVMLLGGCPPTSTGDGDSNGVYHNTTDPTNSGAGYIGSEACRACHPSVAASTQLHAHEHALTAIEGQAPDYPTQATRADVPEPPDGFTWNDIGYVISGYLHHARFINTQGYVQTTGVDGVDTDYLLTFPPNGTSAHFAPYLPGQTEPDAYVYDCFKCHTTNPQPQDSADPRSQDNRPGIKGTWSEAGIRCEACHGPGSNHAPDPQARGIFVDSSTTTCARCHTAGDDPNVIPMDGLFLATNSQTQQLRASGGHHNFACTICHNPHASVTYDRANGLRNTCCTCHADQNMAFHEGAVFRMGDYVEEVTCESCHMPLAAIAGSTADAAVVGTDPLIADVRAHVFRIDTTHTRATEVITANDTLAQDAQGRAALTVDYVCLRCHNTGGNVFQLLVTGARDIAGGMHERAGR